MPGQDQTILIKKTDGTTERISLAEFKLRKKTATPAPAASVQKSDSTQMSPPVVRVVAAVEPEPTPKSPAMNLPTAPAIPKEPKVVRTSSPAPQTKQKLISPAPKTELIEPSFDLAKLAAVVAPAPRRPQPAVAIPQVTADDVRSLLDEPAPVTSAETTVSHDRFDQVDRVLKKVSFSVAPDQANRLRSLIQLRLKDVRSAADTKAVAMRAIKDGGLGLSETSAAELIAATAPTESAVLPKALQANQTEKPNLPAEFHEAGLPANTAPFNSFKHPVGLTAPPARPVSPLKMTAMPPRKSIATPVPVATTALPKPTALVSQASKVDPVKMMADMPRQNFKLNSEPAKIKPVAQDIRPPAGPVGPLEELAALTITDFRRLSNDATAATTQLLQKFANLKDESIVVYFQAIDSWHQSPLYREYSRALITSLSDNKPLSTVLADKQRIQLSELMALTVLETKIKQ